MFHGMGAVGTARLVCIALIVTGIVRLKFA